MDGVDFYVRKTSVYNYAGQTFFYGSQFVHVIEAKINPSILCLDGASYNHMSPSGWHENDPLLHF